MYFFFHQVLIVQLVVAASAQVHTKNQIKKKKIERTYFLTNIIALNEFVNPLIELELYN